MQMQLKKTQALADDTKRLELQRKISLLINTFHVHSTNV